MASTSSLRFEEEKRGFFGRRLGHPLSDAKQAVLDQIYPRFAIPDDFLTEDAKHSPNALFSKPYSKLILEIGFGQGERLCEMIKHLPDNAYIGCEPFLNGMATFLHSITSTFAPDHSPAPHLKVFMDDALTLCRSLSAHCVDELYILNPDPWHKTRHHKRRIVQTKNLDDFARILKPGGILYLSTDVPYLADWMAAQTAYHPAFHWTAKSRTDWETPPEGWIHTRYESKGAKGGKKMLYFVFERKA